MNFPIPSRLSVPEPPPRLDMAAYALWVMSNPALRNDTALKQKQIQEQIREPFRILHVPVALISRELR